MPQATIEELIQRLADPAEPDDVRLETLQQLRLLRFTDGSFHPHIPDYTVALRAASENGGGALQSQVLDTLCLQKDRPTQKRLIEGLEDPAQAFVPPEDALHYLSLDLHAGVYPIARQYAASPPNDVAQHAALKCLGADADSVDIFARILADPAEDLTARRLSSSCLSGLDPERYVEVARSIAGDTTDSPDMRTVALLGLVQADTDPEDDELKRVAEAVIDEEPGDTLVGFARTLLARTPGTPKDDAAED